MALLNCYHSTVSDDKIGELRRIFIEKDFSSKLVGFYQLFFNYLNLNYCVLVLIIELIAE